MSAKTDKRQRRSYRKSLRAEQEEETRRRITAATVELHGTVGPARTTVSAIAERAGVQRATVYRHFPDEVSLFDACSSHWIAEHPLPDTGAWAEVADPVERLRIALEQLYAWYGRGDYMVEKTTRDVSLVPAMAPSMELLGRWFDGAAEVLMAGRPERGRRRRISRCAIAHALAFQTWRSLVREQGLSRKDAVDLMAQLVECDRPGASPG
jgi:AcrR family transcriptional regulator